MKWVLKFIREYNLQYWIANTIIILGSMISKVVPVILLGKIIDEGIYQDKTSSIPYMFAISISMFFIGRLMAYFGILLVDNVRFKLAYKLKSTCYKKLNELDQDFYKNNPLGELTTMLTTDVHTIHHNMCYVIKQSMGILVPSILAIIYCIYINPILTLIVLIPTPIIGFISNKYIKNSKQLYIEQRKYLSNLNDYIQENIEGNKLVKTLATEQNEINDFKIKNKKVIEKNIKIQNANIEYNKKITFLSYCMQLLLVMCGGIFVINGKNLSDGERQVLCYIRTIINNPKVLIFDEATSKIDTKTEKMLQNLIKQMIKNKTIITIAHRLSTIVDSDRIIFIKDKKLTESGTHEELMKLKGDYYNLYMSQEEALN